MLDSIYSNRDATTFFYERFHYLEIMNINSRESSGGKFVEKTATGAGEEA